MHLRKILSDLTLMDRFLFSEAMDIPENMQAVLEIILGKDMELKHPPQTEREQHTSEKKRFVNHTYIPEYTREG
ncbi:MAG: hypothetical protein LIO96_01790 [Lachnospiraceae bacterium]|nr:hypothetical protein [Lachnospiraceae bacterium]